MIFMGVGALILTWIASYFVSTKYYRWLGAGLIVCLLLPFASDVPGLQALAWLLVLYAIPALVTLFRKVRQAPAILLVNVLAGWTIIGWFVALVWASTRDAEAPRPV